MVPVTDASRRPAKRTVSESTFRTRPMMDRQRMVLPVDPLIVSVSLAGLGAGWHQIGYVVGRPAKPRGPNRRCPLQAGDGSRVVLRVSATASSRSAEADGARGRPGRGHRPVDGQHGRLRADDAATLVSPGIDGRLDRPVLRRRPGEHVADLRGRLRIPVMHE